MSSAATTRLQARTGEMAVQMRAVSRYFDNPGFTRALTNVSFEVRRGEVFGLLGPSGSGKSTVMRILAGRLAPSEGRAKVFARSPKRRLSKAQISYLPQKPGDVRSQFLAEAIGFFKDLVAGEKRAARDQNVCDGTEGKRRLETMKRIVVRKTPLVLLDEPFSALDPAGRREMMGFVQAIAQQGRTVILCSASLLDTKDICHRLAVLYRGELQAVGTIQELLGTRESLRFVVDLLPDEVAGRMLQIVRLEAGPSGLTGASPLEGQAPPGSAIAESRYLPPKAEPAPDAILAALLKPTAISEDEAMIPTSTINQKVLAALIKPTGEESPPEPEA